MNDRKTKRDEKKSKNIINVDNISDLGVIFDSKLTFVPHVNNIVSKGCKTLDFIKRITSSFRSIDALKFL